MTDAERRSDGDRGNATFRKTRYQSRSARRRQMSTLAVVAVLASMVACVSTKVNNQPSPSPTVPISTVKMGTKIETPVGNTVVVYSFLPSVGKASGANMVLVAADIQACGGAHATSVTGVQRTLFLIETPDQHAWPSVEAVKKPELKPTLLAANKCARGWVTFSIPQGQKPAYVVLNSSAVVKWKIP